MCFINNILKQVNSARLYCQPGSRPGSVCLTAFDFKFIYHNSQEYIYQIIVLGWISMLFLRGDAQAEETRKWQLDLLETCSRLLIMKHWW